MKREEILYVLESTHRTLKEQSLVPSQEGITDTLKNFIPKIVSDLISFFKGSQNTNDPLTIKTDQREFNSILSTLKYIDIRNLMAYCPEGLSNTYLNYLNDLNEAVEISSSIIEIMDKFNIYICSLVSIKQEINNTADLTYFDNLSDDITNVQSALRKDFRAGSKQDGTIGDFVLNNKEFQTIFNLLNEKNSKINKVDKTALIMKVKNSSEYLLALKDKFQNEDITVAAPNAPEKIASACLAVARALELYSNTYYALLSLTTSIDATCKNLIESSTDKD